MKQGYYCKPVISLNKNKSGIDKKSEKNTINTTKKTKAYCSTKETIL